MTLPLFPSNDAAPSGNGASAKGQSTSGESKRGGPCSSPAVRRGAPDTSIAAARRIAGHVGKQQAAVLAFIRGRGVIGATDAEVSVGVGIPIQSVNPRRGELARDGEIFLNGEKRLTPSGRKARVWVAAGSVAGAMPAEGGACP